MNGQTETITALRELVVSRLRDVPDFPSPGILFRDITPMLGDPRAYAAALELHLEAVRGLTEQIDVVVGIESRGFLFGPQIALRCEAGFVPARKPGKLPAETIAESYALEYGNNTLELHADAITEGAGVLIVDDLIATGGTAAATGRLVERLGGKIVGYLFLIELEALGGRAALGDHRVDAILRL